MSFFIFYRGVLGVNINFVIQIKLKFVLSCSYLITTTKVPKICRSISIYLS